MVIPSGMSEDYVLECIEITVNKLAHSYRFGYHEAEDIKQEGRLEALRALPKYNGDHPLQNFLYVHVKNRLSNFKRNTCWRNEPPCLTCYKRQYEGGNKVCANAINESDYCKKHNNWLETNNNKQNLMNILSFSAIGSCNASYEDDAFPVEYKEIKEKIDLELNQEDRKILLLMRAGEAVTPKKRKELEDKIRGILND